MQQTDPPGCWIWNGAKVSGYGVFWWQKKMQFAHRVVVAELVAAFDRELEIDHLCHQPSCVNPAHLEAVTHSVNMQRARNRNRAKTHCARGHEYAGENLLINSNGKRACRACNRLNAKSAPRLKSTT